MSIWWGFEASVLRLLTLYIREFRNCFVRKNLLGFEQYFNMLNLIKKYHTYTIGFDSQKTMLFSVCTTYLLLSITYLLIIFIRLPNLLSQILIIRHQRNF